MNEGERVRRPEPQRTEPERRWQGAFRGGNGAAGEARPAADTVAEGVQTGYRVMREQLALGQQLAGRFAPELAELWSGSLAGNEEALSGWFRAWGEFAALGADWMGAAGSLRGAGDGRPRGVRAIDIYDVTAPHAFAVTLRLDRDSEDDAAGWTVHPLHAADSTLAPLTDVGLIIDDDGRLRLRARLPDNTAVGRYSGVVVDRADNAPCGTLSLELRA